MKTILLILALCCGIAHADEAQTAAYRGAAEDCITTGLGISYGLTEVHPLGPIVACAIGIVSVKVADGQDEPGRTSALHVIRALRTGAAVHNIAALTIGGAAAPVLGLATAYVLWERGSYERQFWNICADQRKTHPNLKCVWNPA